MTIKALKTTPRERSSSQNGLPESVPYVYRQQKRRNTYAARIAQRNAQVWGQPPAVAAGAGEAFGVVADAPGAEHHVKCSGELCVPAEHQEPEPADRVAGTG